MSVRRGSRPLGYGLDLVGLAQWQIEARRRLEMPEELQKRFGYRPLTIETKLAIFGRS